MNTKKRPSIFDDPAMRPMKMASRVGKETTNHNLILQKLESQFLGDAHRRSADEGTRYDSATDAQIQRYLGAIQASENAGTAKQGAGANK